MISMILYTQHLMSCLFFFLGTYVGLGEEEYKTKVL